MLISDSTNINYVVDLVPSFIMGNYYTERLSPIARLLYILLYNKMLMNLKGGIVDKNGAVYVQMSRVEMAAALGVSKPTIVAAFNALVKCGLICEEQISGYVPLIFFAEPKEETVAMRPCAEEQPIEASVFPPKAAKVDLRITFCTPLSPVQTGEESLPVYEYESKEM